MTDGVPPASRDKLPNEGLDMLEQLRRLYRGLEMSAEIMRDRRRTGGWSGADRTANAFARYAATAQSLYALEKARSATGEVSHD